MGRLIQLALLCGSLAAGGACAGVPPGGTGSMAGESAAPLQDDALRALLVDAYVTAHRGGDDGPGEFFRANGIYQRDGGHGAVVFEGRFEVRDGAVCVWGGDPERRCRRGPAKGSGRYPTIDTDGGRSRRLNTL